MTFYINRRTAIIGTASLALAPLAMTSKSFGMEETHTVEMLTRDPENPRNLNLFAPRLLVVNPGDTVSFVATDRSHNTASIDGMVPEGAEGWESRINEGIDVTLTQPGFYGYKCTPHVSLGMVGLIVVDGDGKLDNLEAARGVRQRGRSMQVWDEIWAEAEEQGLLS